MTENEYKTAKTDGKVEQDEAPSVPKETEPREPTFGYSLDDFIPVLVQLLTPKAALTTAPTFTPKTFLDSVQLFDDGSSRALYLYVSGSWESVPLGTPTANAVGRSYLSSAQSIPTTFNQKVTLDSNSFASGITWDAANNRFVCDTAGKYLVTAALQWSSPTTNFQYSAKLYKNGSEASRGSFIPGNFSGLASSHIADIIDLAAGDTIELYAFQGSGGSVSVSGGSVVTFLSVTQLST